MANEQFKNPTGHRARVRAKFAAEGERAFAPYELLEQLLFFAFQRGDTKPLAKSLLAKYGHLKNIYAAPFDELVNHPGMTVHAAHLIKLTRVAARACLEKDFEEKSIDLNNRERLECFFRASLSTETTEVFEMICLDAELRLIPNCAFRIAVGNSNFVGVETREVVAKAYKSGASSIIIAHNHLSGSPEPSDDDIALTKTIAGGCKAIGVSLLEHIIISPEGTFSFRADGHLDLLYDVFEETARAAKRSKKLDY